MYGKYKIPSYSRIEIKNSVLRDDLMEVSNLDVAGLTRSSEPEITLFVRKESNRMMAILNNMDTKDPSPVWFSGCPGVGKSTALFGYLNLPNVTENGYLWIHFFDDKCHVIHKRKTNMGETDVTSFTLNSQTHNYLTNLVDTVDDVDFVVIDGVSRGFDSTYKLFLTAGMRSNRLKVVVCTSLAGKMPNFELMAYMNIPEYINIDSWSLEEYHDAFKAKLPSFIERFKNIEEINDAYFYVGGSIRFMCSDVNKTISMLEIQFSQVTDYSLILNGLSGYRSSGSINSLMQMFSSKTIPVSNFILRKIADKVGDSFLTAAKRINN